MRSAILATLFWLLTPVPALAGFSLLAADDIEINVEVMQAEGDLLLVFLVEHNDRRPQFDGMLSAIQNQGVEIWQVDLLGDYFLDRSSENIRRLPGDGVAALITEAHRRSDKRILLAAYGRMPLPLLRGVRQWQETGTPQPRLIGALLFYPNLFGTTPVAGQDPELEPIVAATNLPLVIYQPEMGSQRWRLPEMLEALWSGGAPTHVWLVPGVRDWFFLHDPGKDPAEDRATATVAASLHEVANLLAGQPSPKGPAPFSNSIAGAETAPEKQQMHTFDTPALAPELALTGTDGVHRTLSNYRGRVTLVSFWATWCPPCVHELPSLNRLAGRLPEDDFAILSVDFRESPEDIAAFTDRIPVNFPVLLDPDGRISLRWKVFSFPSSFLLDRQGRIRYSVNRAIDWGASDVIERVQALLAEPAEPPASRQDGDGS